MGARLQGRINARGAHKAEKSEYFVSGQGKCPEYGEIQKLNYAAYEFLIGGKYYAFEVSTAPEHKNIFETIISSIQFLK